MYIDLICGSEIIKILTSLFKLQLKMSAMAFF